MVYTIYGLKLQPQTKQRYDEAEHGHTDTGRFLDIIISNSSGKPLYEQITAQIKNMIIAGTLGEGAPLPSMRLLAKELRISVITTKRAYADLERDGFIETVPGKGSFVASKNTEFIREEVLRKVEGHLQSAVELARTSGMTYKELSETLELLYQGE